jgi:sporulation protein YlmC with PRC-barrel domain
MAVMDVKRLIPATRMDMYNVVNAMGEDMGQVQNFMVDADTGRIAFMIVSFGGMMGISDKWIAIPMDVLRFNNDTGNFILDVPRETLEKAPGLDKSRWREQVNLDWLDSVYTCFGCKPYWASDARWVVKGAGGMETLIVSANWLKGHTVRNQAGEDIGKIDDLIIDLQSGYMTYAIADLNAYDALKGRKVAIPIEAFTMGEDSKYVNLNVDRAKLESAPVYDTTRMRVDSTSVGRIYNYYGYSPYWDNRNIWRRRGTAVHPAGEMTAYSPDLYSVSDLLGGTIYDTQDKDVGKMDDLMIDLQSGYLASAIMSAGGILGVGDKYYPLPLEVLSFDPVKKSFYLSVDKETVREAPAFDKDRLPMIDRQGLVDIYAAYGYTPYWRQTRVPTV